MPKLYLVLILSIYFVGFTHGKTSGVCVSSRSSIISPTHKNGKISGKESGTNKNGMEDDINYMEGMEDSDSSDDSYDMKDMEDDMEDMEGSSDSDSSDDSHDMEDMEDDMEGMEGSSDSDSSSDDDDDNIVSNKKGGFLPQHNNGTASPKSNLEAKIQRFGESKIENGNVDLTLDLSEPLYYFALLLVTILFIVNVYCYIINKFYGRNLCPKEEIHVV